MAAGMAWWQFQECRAPLPVPKSPSLPAVIVPIVHFGAWQLRAGCPCQEPSLCDLGGKLRQAAVGAVGRGPGCGAGGRPAALRTPGARERLRRLSSITASPRGGAEAPGVGKP